MVKYYRMGWLCCLMGIFLINCQSDSNNETHTVGGHSVGEELQPLYEEVLAIHDEVMPEMKNITQLQEQLSVKLDTLRRQETVDSEALRMTNRILGNLNRAENAMWSWMHGFSKLDSIPPAEQEKFLMMEKSSALTMRDLMLNSIDSAKTFLHEYPVSN